MEKRCLMNKDKKSHNHGYKEKLLLVRKIQCMEKEEKIILIIIQYVLIRMELPKK